MVMADQVSRLDLQLTVLDRVGDVDWARIAFVNAGDLEAVKAGILGTKLTRSTPEGATFNLGSRASERYLRLYDKTAESKGEYPNRCWRYEIEYKDTRANGVANSIHTARFPVEKVYDAVKAVYGAYGITIPCAPPGRYWEDAGYRHVTDDERRLAWVATCIRPVIRRLVEAYDAETIATLLGFMPVADELSECGYQLDPVSEGDRV